MKKVYKILPLSIYDIPGIESWLEEQANSGFFPVFLNSWVAFTPTGVPGTRFRLGQLGSFTAAAQETACCLPAHKARSIFCFGGCTDLGIIFL